MHVTYSLAQPDRYFFFYIGSGKNRVWYIEQQISVQTSTLN